MKSENPNILVWGKRKKKDQISLLIFYKLMKLCTYNFKLAPTNSLYICVGQNNSDTKIYNSSSMNIIIM